MPNGGGQPVEPTFRRLFLDFAAARQAFLQLGVQTPIPSGRNDPHGSPSGTNPEHHQRQDRTENRCRPHPDELLHRLLSRPDVADHAPILKAALLDPYFPLGMLERTLFAHVTGMRFYIDKDRPELQPLLVRDLVEFAEAFLRIREDFSTIFSHTPLPALPWDGCSPGPPPGQWCRMCGTCCQIGGVPAVAPQRVIYPGHWKEFLEGTRLANQQLCPFLFQSPGTAVHFCSIHPIKPVACSAFDAEDCRARRRDGFLHAADSPSGSFFRFI